MIEDKNTEFKREYKYDASGLIANFLNGKQRIKQFDAIINNPYFAREYKKILKQELDGMFVVIGRYFATLPEEISAVSESMVNNNPLLVIPIAFSFSPQRYNNFCIYAKKSAYFPQKWAFLGVRGAV